LPFGSKCSRRLTTNIREYFPEDELNLGKNKLLEVDSLVENEWS